MTSNLPEDIRNVIVQALLFDLVSFLKMLPFLFVPFLILYLGTRTMKSRYLAYGIGGSIVLILYAVLIKYFATAGVPLGADAFGYSAKEIEETVRGGITIDAISIFLFIIPVAVFWASLAFLYTRKPIKPAYAFVALGAGIVLAFTASGLPARASFASELSYNLAMNKMMYFAADSYAYFSHAAKANDSASLPPVGRMGGTAGAPAFKYLAPNIRFSGPTIPAMCWANTSRLIPPGRPTLCLFWWRVWARHSADPMRIWEALRRFLMNWREEVCTGRISLRHRGAPLRRFPSILASLPFAEQGFNELGKRMPRHLSLMSILKHSGYRLKFYIGSDPDFDNERLFLRQQGVDVLVGIDDYDNTYAKSPGSSWGYPDREVMRKALEMDRRDSRQPYVSFIQTMSMHTSYSIPEQERYLRLVEERMKRLGFDEVRKKEHRTYEKIYSTIMYTDEALRFFFEHYAKLPAYRNTIFIITGDHRLPEIEMSTKIDRFHVPLIIFSPMLKRTASIQSISSQLDITPSLLAFLKKNYHLDVPSTAAWVGTGLDTDPSFRNIHSYPLKHTKTDLIDYISGMYFIDQDTLFSIGKSLDLEPIQDEGKKNELLAEFNHYKSLNDRFTRELKLIPDSLYEQYRP